MADISAGKLLFDISADLQKLDGKLKEAQSKLEGVDKPVEVQIELDTSQADAQISALESLVESAYDEVVRLQEAAEDGIDVSVELGDAEKRLDRLEKKLEQKKQIKVDLQTRAASQKLKKLDRSLEQTEQNVEDIGQEVDVKVDAGQAVQAAGDLKDRFATAGGSVEQFQAKISKVLGVLAGLVAVVQIVGGVGKALRDLNRDAAGVGSEAELAVSGFRRFSESIPVFGAVGIAISDIAMGLGLVEDEVLAVERRLARAEEAAKRFQQALTGERAVEDFKRQLMELQGASELDILQAGLDPLANSLDDQITTVKDTLREAEDELSRLSAAGAGSVGRTGDPDLERAFDQQLEVIRGLKEDLRELAALRPQLIEARETKLVSEAIEAEQAARAKVAQDRAAADQAAADKAKADFEAEQKRQEEEAKQRLQNAKDLEAEREKGRKLQKEAEENSIKAAQDLLALRGRDTKTLEKRRDILEKEVETAKAAQKATRERLGETQAVSTAIGSFTIGRRFGASAGTQTSAEQKSLQELKGVNRLLAETNEILRAIRADPVGVGALI
jgi:DNA repair exonuclease SbcCD ATPase subunit